MDEKRRVGERSSKRAGAKHVKHTLPLDACGPVLTIKPRMAPIGELVGLLKVMNRIKRIEPETVLAEMKYDQEIDSCCIKEKREDAHIPTGAANRAGIRIQG